MELNISNRTVIRVVLITLGLVMGLQLIGLIYTQLIWVFTAFFLALALEPAVGTLSRFLPGKSRGLAVTIVLGLGMAIIAFVTVVLIPPFASQLYHLVTNLPDAYSEFIDNNRQLSSVISSYLNANDASKALEQFSRQLLSFGGSAINIVASIFGGIIAVVTVLLLTFFMVLEGPHWIGQIWKYLPEQASERRQHLLREMHGTITGYVNGNVLTSLIASVSSTLMLLFVHSPYALALGLLVGLLDLIPLVGATLAAILVCILVLVFKGGGAALIMAIFFLIYQQVENNLLQPLVFSRTVKISPLVTTIALILGAASAGFIGALVAIPAAASLQLILKYWLNRHGEFSEPLPQARAKKVVKKPVA